MALPEILIGSKLDAKGFKQAESATEKLAKNVKKLALAFGVAFSAQKIVAFGKQSVKAFMEDEKAATALTKSLNNMGLAFEDSRIKGFISSLESASGVSDSMLRPAMQSLLTTTGSVTKSQELLKLAIDISAGSGENLTTVTQDLSMAMVGNTKGLSKYNLGLSKTQLATMSFTDIQKKFNQQFSGQNAAYLDTYAGKLGLVQIAYDNMQETIGKGLLDSFALLAGEQGIGGATTAMEDFGKAASETILGIASLIKQITPQSGMQGEPGFWHDLYIAFGGQIIEDLRKLGRKAAAQQNGAPGVISGKSLSGSQYFAAQEKASKIALEQTKKLAAIEKARLDTAKKLAAEKAKKVALDKLSAFLNKAQNVFDLERIQLAAAALGKQSEEDKVRIRLKQEILDLEQAINDGNVEGAAKLAAAIATDAQLLGQLRGDMVKLGDVPNPFAEWLQTLLAIAAQLAALANIPVVLPTTGGFVPGTTPGQTGIPGMGGMASPGFGMGGWTEAIPPSYAPGAIPGAGRGFSMASVTVNVQGSISTERDIVAAITEGIYNNQASGIPINYSTVY